MDDYKFKLLCNFISTLEMTNADVQNAILEAINVIEDSDEASDSDGEPPITDAEDTVGIEIQWAVLHDKLKTYIGDEKAGDMQVILRNGTGDTYLIFKKSNKVEFVKNASGNKESEIGKPKEEGSKFLGKQSYS